DQSASPRGIPQQGAPRQQNIDEIQSGEQRNERNKGEFGPRRANKKQSRQKTGAPACVRTLKTKQHQREKRNPLIAQQHEMSRRDVTEMPRAERIKRARERGGEIIWLAPTRQHFARQQQRAIAAQNERAPRVQILRGDDAERELQRQRQHRVEKGGRVRDQIDANRIINVVGIQRRRLQIKQRKFQPPQIPRQRGVVRAASGHVRGEVQRQRIRQCDGKRDVTQQRQPIAVPLPRPLRHRDAPPYKIKCAPSVKSTRCTCVQFAASQSRIGFGASTVSSYANHTRAYSCPKRVTNACVGTSQRAGSRLSPYHFNGARLVLKK